MALAPKKIKGTRQSEGNSNDKGKKSGKASETALQVRKRRQAMNSKYERKTGYMGMWVMMAVLLCSAVVFTCFLTWERSDLDGLSMRSTRIITLQHKINVLANRISDIESGEYYRRIAALTGREISSDAVQTFIIANKLNGSIAENKKELEKMRIQLAKLTDKKADPAMAGEESPSTRVAPVIALLDN
jgi:uncharacterized coiled-coil protein SlyX